MKKKILGWIGVLLIGGMSLNGWAAGTSEKRTYLFGGLDLGLAAYSASSFSGDVSRSGLAAGIRGGASFYFPKWVLDGSLAFLFISAQGTNTFNNELFKTTTRTVAAAFSPRYRIQTNFQVGPEIQYFFGTDTGLNLDIRSASETNHALLGGLNGVYEWQGSGSTKYRFGARWNTDLNISPRNLNLFQLFFQIGFSPMGSGGDSSGMVEELRESDLKKAGKEPVPSVETESYEDSGEDTSEPDVIFTPPPPKQED